MQNNIPIKLSPNQTQRIIWTLLLIMPIIGMVVDLIAPSLPAIAEGLHISNHAAQNAISVYLLGYAVGNFFTGFLSDAWGRQKLIRINLAGFVLVSVLPVFFPHIEVLLLARLLQGITMGAVAVSIRAILSDILPSHKLIPLGTLIGTMWGLGPVMGPILGGYLQTYFGWKAGFCFFAFITLIMLAATYLIVPETHFNRHPLRIKTIAKHLTEIFKHSLFISIVILMGLAYSLLIVFNTMGPFLIQSQLHYSPRFFGHISLCFGLVFLLATFVCRHFLKQYDVNSLLQVVVNVALVMALILFGTTLIFKNSILVIAVTSGLMFFTCGFLFPMSMGKGASLFRHIAGAASATMYLINILITSLCSLLVSFINVKSFIPLMSVYLSLIVGCALIYWVIIRKAA